MPRGNRVSHHVASLSLLVFSPSIARARFAFCGVFFFFIEIGLDQDASDEPQWYIPAGINLPDLQRTLTVIEQFEKAPLDLEGKRAAQLLHKKRQARRRRRRHQQTTPSGSEYEAKEDDDDEVRKVARKAREREKYMSAQFIEDSDEEYGRDIEGFFEREAALRERTALAAIDSLSHIGTMRPTGTKKRRRAQPPLGTTTDAVSTTAKGRQAKRSRRSAALSSSGMHDGDGEGQGEGQGEDGDRGRFNAGALRPSSPAAAASFSDDDGDDDDADGDDGGDDGSGGGDIDHSDSSSRSLFAHRDSVAGKHGPSDPPPLAASKPRRPRARPRFRGVPVLPSNASDNAVPDTPPRKGTDEDDVGHAQPENDLQPIGVTTAVLSPSNHKDGDPGRQASTPTPTSSSNGGGPRRGRRLIISDEEE